MLVVDESIDEQSGNRNHVVLVKLYEGHHFGEYSLLREQPRLASVIAKYVDELLLSLHTAEPITAVTLCASILLKQHFLA